MGKGSHYWGSLKIPLNTDMKNQACLIVFTRNTCEFPRLLLVWRSVTIFTGLEDVPGF